MNKKTIALIMSVIVLWQLIALLMNMKTLPSPVSVAGRTVELIYPKPLLLLHVAESTKRLIIGYLIALVLGLSVGIISGLEGNLKKIINPLMGFMISIPTIAWVPLLLILVGLGDKTIILAIFLGGFFPIAYNMQRGMEIVNLDLIRAAKIMGLKDIKCILHVYIPASMPSVITGARLGIGYSWRALVGAEMLAATEHGIGFMIYASRAFQDVPAMFLGLIVIGVLSYVTDKILITSVENKTIKKWGMVTQHG